MFGRSTLLILGIGFGFAPLAQAYNADFEADNFTTCAATNVAPLLPNLDLLHRLAAPTVAETQERYSFKLPNGTQMVLENVRVLDETDANDEAEKSPQLAAALDALPDDQYGDYQDPYQIAGKASRHKGNFSNRGILGPGGRWPVGSGDCATLTGQASFYGGGEKLKSKTASGGRFNAGAIAAANRTLPLGTRIEVKNLNNGKTLNNVVVNDRGPAIETGRLIDLTKGAASKLDFVDAGHTQVQIRVCRGGAKGQKLGMLN